MKNSTLLSLNIVLISMLSGCGGSSSDSNTAKTYELDEFLYTTYDGYDNTKQTYETTEEFNKKMELKLNGVQNTSLNLYGDAFHEDSLRYKSFSYDADTNTGTINIRFSNRDGFVPSFNTEPSFTGISYEVLKTKSNSDESSDNPYLLEPIASDYGKLESTHEFVFDNVFSANDVVLTESDAGYCEDTTYSFTCVITFYAEPNEAEAFIISERLDLNIAELSREREWNYTTYSGVRNYKYDWFYPASFKKITIYDKNSNRVFGVISKD